MVVAEHSDKNGCEGSVGVGVEKKMLCVNMSVMLCWRILV